MTTVMKEPNSERGKQGMRIYFQGLHEWDTSRLVDLVLSVEPGQELIDETGALTSLDGRNNWTVDMSGLILAPALVDPHVHFRDPGQVEKEDMKSGSAAAAAGGYGQVLIMPNTDPPLDGESRMSDGRTPVEYLQSYENNQGWSLPVRYALCVAASKKRAGLEPSNPAYWSPYLPQGEATRSNPGAAAHPILAISDDGAALTDPILEAVARNARNSGIPILDHCEHHESGLIHEGSISRQLGLPGIPSSTELAIVQRDIDLASRTGTHIHLQHVSTREAFQAIRQAKSQGLPVTCETAPHYLVLSDEDVPTLGSLAKMNPPLRSKADQEATLEAVADGTVDMIATDHAPHTIADKSLGMDKAPNGVIGLETAYGVCNQALVRTGLISPHALIELMSLAPARLMGTPVTRIEDLPHRRPDSGRGGDPGRGERQFPAGVSHATSTPLIDLSVSGDDSQSGADLVIMDPAQEWIVDPSRFHSKARNTPFGGMTLTGRIMATIKGSHLVFSRLPTEVIHPEVRNPGKER